MLLWSQEEPDGGATLWQPLMFGCSCFIQVTQYLFDYCRVLNTGDHLADFLEEYGITPYRLSKDIHVPPTRIDQIMKCKRGITVDTAKRLGMYFGNTAQYWLNLQNGYDLEMLDIEDTIVPIAECAEAQSVEWFARLNYQSALNTDQNRSRQFFEPAYSIPTPAIAEKWMIQSVEK